MFKNVRKEEITIPAQMSYLIQVREFIEHIGKRYKYPEKMINSFKLVIDEACTNIIRHGYRDIKNGEIQIKAIVRRLSLTIVIVDQGTSYDPRQANTPDLAKYVDIGKKGGLGILMMRKLMDDIQYAVTEHGNEFRLTKYREKRDEPKWKQALTDLNLRTKYSLVAAAVLTIIVFAIYSILFYNLETSFKQDVLSNTSVLSNSLADNSIDDLLSENPTGPFERAKAIKSNNPQIIFEAFIINNNSQVEAVYPLEESLLGTYSIPENASFVDSIDGSAVYKYTVQDTIIIYDIAASIEETIAGKLGNVHLWVKEATLTSMINQRRITLIISMLIILGVGYVGSFFLVSNILKSFHSLADWVRQVVRGKVDQDEIDIDASDEIGEIAQAFNEMTQKFRKAQVNLMEQQKLQKELQVAQEIQQMLLPNDFPKVEGFDIGSYYEAAKEVGGDLFDFVEVDDDTVGIIVADVSGKGVPGSLIMTMIRTAIRLESRGNRNPADVLARVNKFVTDDMKRGMFVTMFYVVLDSRNRVIHYASAGHNPMILYRSSTKQTYYLNPSGFPVGIQLPDIELFDKKIETDSIRLREDDILVLYTDGITEAMNHKRELYREERFLQAIREHGHFDVAEFVKSVKDDLKNFTGGAPQNDDITFVSIKEKLMPGEIIYKTHKQLWQLIEDGMRVSDACEKLNVSKYQYYKYKNIIDEGGLEALHDFLDGKDYIEKKHISIEIKAKIFDIIRQNPKTGAKRISDILNTEKYGNIELTENRIYNELVKMRLNTQKLRERFVEKGHHKRLKQPGTPLLTLDGKVILDFESSEEEVSRRTGKVEERFQQQPAKEEKKPFVKEFHARGDDDESKAKIMHQQGAAYKPKVKSDEELKAEQTAKEEQEKEKEETKAVKAKKPEVKQTAVEDKVVSSQTLEEQATTKFDQKKYRQFFNETKDDYSSIEKLINNLDQSETFVKDSKKITLILKIMSKNPILKNVPEMKQVIKTAVTLSEMLSENSETADKNKIANIHKRMLNSIKKENILDSSEGMINKINELGALQNEWKRSLEKKAPEQGSDLSLLRQKIARKKLVSNLSLLENDNPKS